MKTINKVFLILLVSLAASALFAQSNLSIGYRTSGTEINTFVQKLEGAGDLTAAVQAADGSYVMVSRIESASFIVRRIKLSGQKQWERTLNFDLDWDSARILGIAQTTDGGFVLAGYAGCESEIDCGRALINGATLVKLRANGTVAWKRITASGFSRFFASVIPMPDGGVIAIGGDFHGFGGLIVTFQHIVRVSSTGDVVWKKKLTTPPVASYGSFPFPLVSSTATPDNGFIVAFPTSTNLNNRPPNGVDVLKITNSGNIVWEKSLKADDFVFKSIGVTANGGVILVGTGTDSTKLKMVALKADGTLIWKAGYSFPVSAKFQSISSPVQTLDGGYLVIGTRGGKGFIAENFIGDPEIDSSRKVVFQTLETGLAAGSLIFATPDAGFFLFGKSGLGLLAIKVNSEKIVPGCEYFGSSGRTTSASFGPLRISEVKITTADDLLLEPLDFGLSSVATNHPVSTLCQ